MRKIFLLFVFYYLFFFAHYSFSQSGWYLQQSGFQYNLRDFFFIDSQNGWICTDSGYVLKTTNGGTNWTIYSTGSTLNLYSIKFVNNMTGWTAGGAFYNNPFGYQYCIILKTTNGGNNWTTQFFDSYGPQYNNLAAINENFVFTTANGVDIYGMGSTGNMSGTSNGGLNWNLGVSGVAFSHVTFLNSNLGWACAFRNLDVPPTVRMIYKTTNSGLNWVNTYKDTINAFYPIFQKLQFINTNSGYLITNLLKKTTNGGTNWQNVDSINTYGLVDMCFLNIDTGWICKNPIKRTNNGGINWINQIIPASVNKLFFVNGNTGWGLGVYNKVLIKTTTGGTTFIKKNSEINPEKYSLSQNFPNPFNPSTKISFKVPSNLSSLHVLSRDLITLKIYDILGKEVATLINEKLQPGEYETTFDAVALPSGIYFYTLSTNDFKETKKMLMIK